MKLELLYRNCTQKSKALYILWDQVSVALATITLLIFWDFSGAPSTSMLFEAGQHPACTEFIWADLGFYKDIKLKYVYTKMTHSHPNYVLYICTDRCHSRTSGTEDSPHTVPMTSPALTVFLFQCAIANSGRVFSSPPLPQPSPFPPLPPHPLSWWLKPRISVHHTCPPLSWNSSSEQAFRFLYVHLFPPW